MTLEDERKMFGMTIVEMEEEPLFTNLKDPVDLIIYAQSIISDMQSFGLDKDNELVLNQWANKAKYFLSEAKTIIRERERNNIK